MSHFTGKRRLSAVAVSAVLLAVCTGCATNESTPLPTVFTPYSQSVVLKQHDMGAAEAWCKRRMGDGTQAEADCYSFAQRICNDTNTTKNPEEPLRGDCTRRME